MTNQDDLLLEEFHEAGIWLPEEVEVETNPIWGRIQQCAVNAKTIQTNRYMKAGYVQAVGVASIETSHGFHQPGHRGACEAPWNLEPSFSPSRQRNHPWSASWRGLRGAVARQLYCRPALLGAFIVAAFVAFGLVLVS